MGDGPGRGPRTGRAAGGSAETPAAGPHAAARHAAVPPPPPDHEAERVFSRAVEVHRAGRVVEAVRHHAEALARDPGHVEALNNLGVLLRGQGRQAAAEACSRRPLALAPGHAGCHRLFRQRAPGDWDGAVAALLAALDQRLAAGEGARDG